MKNTILKVLLVVVFLGIAVIWIVSPTKFHRQHWTPKIRAKADTTYFGSEGATILEYTLPVLLLATLGCVYLHFVKKVEGNRTDGRTGGKYGLSALKRPLIVRGPLGVVSWIETAFVLMFLALLIWSFGTYLQIGFSQGTLQSAHKHGLNAWEARLATAGLTLGLVGNICLAFLFFPVTRGSSLLPLLGLTSESSIKYHIWLGHVTMTLFAAHGVLYIVVWGSSHQLSDVVLPVAMHVLTWSKSGMSIVAGEASLLAGLALWAATFPRIRRKTFEVFFYTHHLYILFVVFFVFHVGAAYSCIMLPGLYLFVVDRYLRFLQARTNVRLLSSRVLPCETVELNFSKSAGLEYTPTSIVFVNVPSVSRLQWHPFTITSNSNLEKENLSIVIQIEGSWSRKLYRMLSSPSPVERLAVAVEGPYGPASTNYLRHDALVMVSGGSGITPFISIIRELVFIRTSTNTKTPRVLLISVFRRSVDLTVLDLVLPIYGTSFDISTVQLQIEAYVTREQEPVVRVTSNSFASWVGWVARRAKEVGALYKTSLAKQKENKREPVSMDAKSVVRTIRFTPNAFDQSISAILGPNNWLWLGAIIVCSFVVYLIMLSLITRFHIYPIDHNTNTIYPAASRDVIFMLLVCLSVAVTSSAVVYMNKTRNAATEAKHVGDSDRELERFPSESLIRATNVHYGSRPDLKKILLGVEGLNVGVLVSGPRQMRHEVAAICLSEPARKLHFESMSFSW